MTHGHSPDVAETISVKGTFRDVRIEAPKLGLKNRKPSFSTSYDQLAAGWRRRCERSKTTDVPRGMGTWISRGGASFHQVRRDRDCAAWAARAADCPSARSVQAATVAATATALRLVQSEKGHEVVTSLATRTETKAGLAPPTAPVSGFATARPATTGSAARSA